MRFSLRLVALITSPLLLLGCDNPSDSNSENVATQKELKYNIVEYDNFPKKNPMVQVIYSNLDSDLVVDTVEVPWSKSFDYRHSTNSEELKTNLIVEYAGEEGVALKATIEADKSTKQSGIGYSFLLEIENAIKIAN